MDDYSHKFYSQSLEDLYQINRNLSVKLISNLQPEDMVVQTEDFVSPVKWHLGHTTWFFEQFILIPYQKNYRLFDKSFNFIFNSYYNAAGDFNPRNKRGFLNRPLTSEVLSYRKYIDAKMMTLIPKLKKKIKNFDFLIKLGINHEQQHQELMLMDIKNIFFNNYLKPVFKKSKSQTKVKKKAEKFVSKKNVNENYGYIGNDFCYDNELPSSNTSIEPFTLSPFVTNLDWKNFIKAGCYENYKYWLSDGWDFVKKNKINKPMYWIDKKYMFTLNGIKKINDKLPVSHISFYEADAYARFKKKRLPTEIEVEYFLKKSKKNGNFLENEYFNEIQDDKFSAFGNLWVWTSSNYLPYKNYIPYKNKLNEYNSKFMCNQFVLKGGSYATPKDHIRPSYRNFYYPSDRWQFCGLKIAESI